MNSFKLPRCAFILVCVWVPRALIPGAIGIGATSCASDPYYSDSASYFTPRYGNPPQSRNYSNEGTQPTSNAGDDSSWVPYVVGGVLIAAALAGSTNERNCTPCGLDGEINNGDPGATGFVLISYTCPYCNGDGHRD